MRDNLIVFARRKGRCFPAEGNQSSPYTSGAYVDGKQEISSSGVQEFRSSGVAGVLGSSGGEERYQNVSRFELSANGKHWRPSTMRAGEVASASAQLPVGTGGPGILEHWGWRLSVLFFDA